MIQSKILPWIGALIMTWILHFALTGNIDQYFFDIILYAGINITLAVSLNLVNGFTGQFSMGHAGFMAVGAYASAFISSLLRAKNPELVSDATFISTVLFLGSLTLGGIMAGLVGFIVGLPSLRLKGDYLAIVTLGMGEIIRVVLLNMDFLGGARGFPNIPHLSNFGWIYTVAVITAFVVWRLVQSSFGRTFLAVREDEIAAEAMGVNTTQAKIRAFVIGAFFAGVAGGLYGHQLMFLAPSVFDFNRSFVFVTMVVLGGMGSISGSIFASIFLTVLPEALRPLQEITRIDFRMIIYSLLLIVMMLTRPNGLFGTKEITDFFKKNVNKPKPGVT